MRPSEQEHDKQEGVEAHAKSSICAPAVSNEDMSTNRCPDRLSDKILIDKYQILAMANEKDDALRKELRRHLIVNVQAGGYYRLDDQKPQRIPNCELWLTRKQR